MIKDTIIKVGQKYKILKPEEIGYEDEYEKGDVVEIERVDSDGDGRFDDSYVLLKSEVEAGDVKLITDEQSPLVNAVFDDIISNHVNNPHIAETIVDTFNYELREEFVKRVFGLEDV